jgi:hypothetical protein
MKKYNIIAAFAFTVFVLNIGAVGEPVENKPWYSRIFGGMKTGADNVKNHIVAGTNDGVKECAKETIKSAYTNFILTPLIIKPLQNILYPTNKAEKIKNETAEIIVLAEQIKKLKDAGASRRYISLLSAQLTKKIQDSSSKFGSGKGNK